MNDKSSRRLAIGALLVAALLGACATVPTGPSVMALPGTGRTFDQFRADDAACRQYAWQQIGGVTAGQAAANSAVGSAAVGTAIGAIAGAAIGGREGAAVGAGTGLLFGSAAGAGASQATGYEAQRRYDHAYIQCMYASGHRVPVSGTFSGASRYQAAPTPPPAYAPPPAYTPAPPPPPAGAPPPPPPGVTTR
jgi:hypothetical protein